MTADLIVPGEGGKDSEQGARAEARKTRLRRTSELSTTDLYQRRKRNLLLFGSVVTLITFTRPQEEIPVPLLNGEVTLPVELAFLACLMTTMYFAWEFYADWETARRRNAEIAAETQGAESLGSALETLISKTSAQFAITATQMEQALVAVENIESSPDRVNDRDVKQALANSSASLIRIANELPRWRRSAGSLRTSYTQLHESVSRLQKTNFYLDLIIATAVTSAAVASSGYIVLAALLLG